MFEVETVDWILEQPQIRYLDGLGFPNIRDHRKCRAGVPAAMSAANMRRGGRYGEDEYITTPHAFIRSRLPERSILRCITRACPAVLSIIHESLLIELLFVHRIPTRLSYFLKQFIHFNLSL